MFITFIGHWRNVKFKKRKKKNKTEFDIYKAEKFGSLYK